ncbi:hypothetical protein ACFFGH_01960 [Lysobacter korlensis]|uniref:Uncharacterized protein n=1 Tax=Lysobacter korlensis TaxID=553636 RepID=A0ABV6RJR1_9GAMM
MFRPATARPCRRPAPEWSLLQVVTVLVALVFALQGLATAAKRMWAPTHYHVDVVIASPASPAYGVAESASEHVDVDVDAPAGHAVSAAAPSAAVTSAQAVDAGRVHAAAHRHRASHRHPHPHTDSQPDRETADHVPTHASLSVDPAHAAAADATASAHRHAASNGHRHAAGRADVVIVDEGATHSSAANTVSGLENVWSLLPTGVELPAPAQGLLRVAARPVAYVAHRLDRLDRPPRV